MTLQETIKEQMKAAMRERDMAKVTTMRGLMSAFTNEVVAAGKSPDTPITDEEAIVVITRESKRRKDSIKQFTDAGRAELAADEEAELAMLETFLPEMMSVEDIKTIAAAKIAGISVTSTTLATTATAAAALTPGYCNSAASTSKEEIFSPRRRIMSFTRSTKK